MSNTAILRTDFADELAQLKAELALVERPEKEPPCNRRWRRIIDSSNDAFLATDASGCIIEWNINAQELFGWTAEEVTGCFLADTVFPDTPEQHCAGGLQHLLLQHAEGKRLETFARTRDGRDIPVEVSISPMQEGSEIVFNAFIHDITQRRELQMKLTHAQKLESIGQLSAGIAHEINTPTQYVGDNTRFVQEALGEVLDVIEAYGKLAEAVRQGKGQQEALADVEQVIEEVDLDYLLQEVLDAAEQSLEGVNRVSRIVRAMKEFSHPGSDAKTATNLNKAITNTITVATNEWKYVADITTDFDENLPLVPCLPGDFNQVILNMIVNAAHAIGDCLNRQPNGKGTIRISTRKRGNHAEIRITDTGTGMPAEVAVKIFDPFFTTKDVGIGTGQGLAISRSVIVDKHQGTLDVETKLGEGTTFIIRLPLSPNSDNNASN